MAEKMADRDIAIEAISEFNPGATDRQVSHAYRHFLRGTLYIITFNLNGVDCENYVFLKKKSPPRVAKNFNLLMQLLTQESNNSPIVEAMAELINIANIIAIALTLLIGYLVVARNATEIPAVLTTALTTIIGFYFGTKSAKSES